MCVCVCVVIGVMALSLWGIWTLRASQLLARFNITPLPAHSHRTPTPLPQGSLDISLCVGVVTFALVYFMAEQLVLLGAFISQA